MLDRLAFSLLLACVCSVVTMPQVGKVGSFPEPFTRVLFLEDPPIEGTYACKYFVYLVCNTYEP